MENLIDQNDITAQELRAAGKTGRKVEMSHIQALMQQVRYVVSVPEGETTTFVHAYLGRFFLATGMSACVVPENFVAAIGERIARADAEKKAIQKLWELEGYALYKELNSPATHSLDDIARIAHEVNRAYCQALGDDSQPSWEDAPAWQRESARMGVDLHLMGDFGPEASHISWSNQKLAEGWVYGPVKNPEAKQHPCLVPFDQLPREQQAKDYLFRGVVHAFKQKAQA